MLPELWDRLSSLLLARATPAAVELGRPVAEGVEPDERLRPLALAMCALGEGVGLRGLLRLASARRLLLAHAVRKCIPNPQDQDPTVEWLERFEARLDAHFRASRPAQDPREAPEQLGDRLHYLLWSATRKGAGSDRGVRLLLYDCHSALRERLGRAPGSRGAYADLPNALTIFMRWVPDDALDQIERGERGVRPSDVAAAVEAYRRATRITEHKAAEYRREVVATVCGPVSSGGLFVDSLLRERLGLEPYRSVRLDEAEDDDGRPLGLIAYEEGDDEAFDHPLESAVYVPFGNWRRIEPGRAPTAWTTRDRRVVTKPTLPALADTLDRLAADPASSRLAFLVWGCLVTGMAPEDFLAIAWAPDPDTCSELVERGERTLVYCEADETIRAARPADAYVPRQRVAADVYMRTASSFALALGERGRRYARAAVSGPRSRPGAYLYPHPKRSDEPLSRDFATNALVRRFLGPLWPAEDPPTWSKIARSLRPYAEECGMSPLVSALASGRAARAHLTVLHYVAYDAAKLFADHALVVASLEAAANGSATTAAERPEPPPLAGVLGACYAPRPSLVRSAWEAIRRATDTPGKRSLTAATLRFAFALSAATGIRLQELPALRRARVDRVSGLIRLSGKPNAFFEESREVPIPAFALAELDGYLSILDDVGVSRRGPLFWLADRDADPRPLGPGDLRGAIRELGLDEAVPFSLRTLRHALRTRLDEQGAPFALVNAVFGHVTYAETHVHTLSGASLGECNRVAREHLERAVRWVLGEGGHGS